MMVTLRFWVIGETAALVAGCSFPLLGSESDAARPARTLALADNGRARYTVAVTSDPIPAERHAAQELAHFLGQVTGGTFVVAEASRRTQGPRLLVGAGVEARELVGAQQFDGLGKEGVLIETVGHDIVLTGGRPRGTLYAVYTFLEDAVGCRWWTPEVSMIPRKRTLAVPELHVRYVPVLEYREPFCRSMFDTDWAARNKVNRGGAALDAKRGGGVVYRDFCHSLHRLVPAEEHFGRHPEWFSERDGMRFHEGGQLCLTNEGLREFVAGRTLAWLRAPPDAHLVSVSQNDCGGRCECTSCAALEAEEGAASGPLIHFVNAIAAEVEKEFPQVAVSTLAYRYTRRPPKRVRPRHNVVVRLCSIECSSGRPLDARECRPNRGFVSDLGKWAEICDRLYIWDYVANIKHLIPYPNLHVLGPNIRLFVKHGVKGVFAQGEGRSRGYAMGGLRAWLLAKLMWRPHADVDELTRDFVGGVFGPAADSIARYVELMGHAVQATKAELNGHATPSHPFLSLDVMAKAEALFERAERAASKAPGCLNRVQLARLPLRYVWAMRWDYLKRAAQARGQAWPGPPDYLGNAEAFIDVAKGNRLSADMIRSFEEAVLGDGRREAPPPPGCEHRSPSAYLDLQDREFWLRPQDGVALVPDPAASDRIAAHIPADCWAYAGRIVWVLIVGLGGGGAVLYAFWLPSRPWLGAAGLVAALAVASVVGLLSPGRLADGEKAGSGLAAALGVGVFGLVAWGGVLCAVVCLARRRKRNAAPRKPTTATRLRGSLWGGLAGVASAVVLVSAVYSLGCVAHAAEGRRVMLVRHVVSSYESVRPQRRWQRALIKLLAGAKTTLQRSSFGSLLDRYCPADEDACDPLWAVSRPLCYPLVDGRTKFRCRAAVRCELTGRPGPAFQVGVYDPIARRSCVRRLVSAKEMDGNGYQTLELGTHIAKPEMYLWVAPPTTAGAVRSIVVDRFVLAAETHGGSGERNVR